MLLEGNAVQWLSGCFNTGEDVQVSYDKTKKLGTIVFTEFNRTIYYRRYAELLVCDCYIVSGKAIQFIDAILNCSTTEYLEYLTKISNITNG